MEEKKNIFKFESISRMSIPEIIVSRIKDKIFSGELPPGEKLPSEKELVSSFNTSRITVRSAIRILQTLDLIEVRRGAGGGAFVREIDSTHCSDFLSEMLVQGLLNISEITETRLLFEPSVAKMAAERADADDINSMQKCLEKVKSLSLENKKSRTVNINFHNLVAKSTHNKMIYFEITSITRIVARNVDYSELDSHDIESTLKRHGKILNAIHNKDSEEAFKQMYNDIEMVHLALKKSKKSKKSTVSK